MGKGSLALVVVAVVACDRSQAPATAPVSRPTIEVLDAGSEPHRRVRYDLAVHAPEQMVLTVKLRTATAFTNTVLENGHTNVDLPSVQITALLEVSALDPSGNATVGFAVADVSVLDDAVDPALRPKLEKAFAGMKGVRGSWSMSPSGEVAHITSGRAGQQLVQVDDSVQQSIVEFPDVELGAGATWRVTSELVLAGVHWQRTVKYRLESLDEAAAVVQAEIAMKAGSQALSVEPNATTTVSSGTSTMVEDLTVPLHGLVPVGTAQGSSELNFSIVQGHLRITSTVRTETTLAMQR